MTTLALPAFATAHSHAFQRGMRGAAQRRSTTGDDFWTWRGQMYRLANLLTPESIALISRVAFRELYRAGVRTVGEFHYIQHQADGTPYEDRTLLSDVVIAAARAEGLRIALLRVAYHRAGPGMPAEADQRRFCDPDVDAVLRDVETLRAKYADQPDVRIGIAPHSVRAVPPAWLKPLAEYAAREQLPFHMHVAEQQREVDECVAETGKRPVELLADLGILSDRFVAVHATQLLVHESRMLGAAKARVCVCATTERDLGDGLPDLSSLRESGVELCMGVDSHVVTDPFEDMRSLETHERLRTHARITFNKEDESPAQTLWRQASLEGARACGFEDEGGTIEIRRDHPILELVEADNLLDAIVFSGRPELIAWQPRHPVDESR